MKVSIYRIKKAITAGGLNVLDARMSWSSVPGFKVTEYQSDNWLIETAYSGGKAEEAARECVKVLAAAGIEATADVLGWIVVGKEQ